MNRRQFVRRSVGTASLAAIPTLANYVQPAIRTIYSNDTTHILSCQRPEARRAGFTDELLAASITVAAGVDPNFQQAGLGWMPWWRHGKVFGSLGLTAASFALIARAAPTAAGHRVPA
jgi:hypothetical protein